MEREARLAIGGLLRRYRKRRGWTQEETAGRAGSGFSVDTIGRIERGQHRPRATTLQELIAALQLSDSEREEILSVWKDLAAPPAETGLPETPPVALRWPMGDYLGSRPSAGLVARIAELRRTMDVLEASGRGSGRLVLVAGEAGIGKTRLAQEIAVGAGERSFLVAVGRCYEPQQSVPFHPFREALAALVDHREPHQLRDVTRRWPYLARLFPENAESQDFAAGTGHAEQQRLFRDVTAFVRSVAEAQPVAIMLDDLHWADTPSLDLLLHLARHARGAPIFLLGIYRDVGLVQQHPLATLLGDLTGEQLVEPVRLNPLTQAETAALASDFAGRPLSEELLDLVYSRTEGNPFFVRQLLHALQVLGGAEGELVASLDNAGEVPDSVRMVIRRRTGRLSDETGPVLSEGSVLGQAFGFAELQYMGGHDEVELEDALDEAIEAGLLRDLGDDRYAFDHALTQQSIYGDLSSRRKRRLHRAAAAALEQLPARKRDERAAEIAWHFLRGDDPERALPWTFEAAVAAAAVFAHREAERQYRTAVELARDVGDERAEVEGLYRLGEVLHRLGRYGDALEFLERAAEIYREVDSRDRYLTVMARIGEAYTLGGRSADGLARLLPVVKALEDGELTDSPSHSMAELYSALGGLYLGCGRWQEALETLDTAISLAESTQNRRALCTAEISRGLALGVAGRVAEQRQAFHHAAEIAEPLGDQWLLALGVYHHGVSYVSSHDFERGERHMRRALEIADGAALLGFATFIRSNLSDLLVAHGRWTEARAEAERAGVDRQDAGPGPGDFYPLASLGRIHLLQGDREEGLRRLDEALALARRYEHRPGIANAHETLAWQEVRDGRPEDAIARLESLPEPYRAGSSLKYATVYAWALLETGNEDQASEVLQGARQRATASRSRTGLPDVLLQSARLAVRQGRWTDAVRDLWEGAAVAQEMDLPYDEALLLAEYGRMHAARGELEQARMRLDEALAIFRRLGAVPDIERAEQALHDLMLPRTTPPAPARRHTSGTSGTVTDSEVVG